MVQNSMRDIIQRYAKETIGETDFQTSRNLKAKYAELISLQSKFSDNIVVITMVDFCNGVKEGTYSLSSNVTYRVIEGTEESPILGTVLTKSNFEELSEYNNYVGYIK